jgi:ABC-type dipeptide/oligopeptide/nickel transport system permease subunit
MDTLTPSIEQIPPGNFWRMRAAAWWRGSLQFVKELAQHPISMMGGIVVLVFVLAAIFAPQITTQNPEQGKLRNRLKPPVWEDGGSSEFLLGTDSQGRDLLTRIVFGARVSLLVGVLTVGIAATVGVFLGAVAGYFRGRIDMVLSRFADLLMAFPFLIFAIAMMAFIGPGFGNLILALTFKGWVEFFRLVRGEIISEKTKEYVEAAHALGRSDAAIIVSEMLPNIIQSVFFLGLGIQPPTPAWGSMVASGRDVMLTAWWVSTMPGIAILLLVLSLNIFGEGLRDILDPRLKTE